MLFSSPWFFAFLALVLAWLALPWSVDAKKRWLALASCLFYAAWDYRYLGLLLFISAVDYGCARRIADAPQPRQRRGWLMASLVSNLGLLAYFKYTNFLIDSLNGPLVMAGFSLPHANILLPAGISFYTFKTMSYVIDVYRRELEPVDSLADYVTFVTFFPELIAGPIVRASVLLPQLKRNIGPTVDGLAAGLSIFLLGYTKKLVADRLGVMNDPVFAHPERFDGLTLLGATLGYSCQILCDFSGYSDMAVGTARTIGYDLPENFALPYLSANIAEFWRRWHMTLSSWLRDYLYVPLGGNRKGEFRTYVNLMATMLLGGLWHGASWNFVLWGGLHGVALALHRLARSRFPRLALPPVLGVCFTFAFVTLAWIPFRAQSFGQSMALVRGLFGWQAGLRWQSAELWWLLGVVAFGHVAGAWLSRGNGTRALLAKFDLRLVRDELSGWYLRFGIGTVAGVWLVVTWILLALLFAPTKVSPFIYFQF
jgi:alginate O-acetyltransferase complex protein AlgI